MRISIPALISLALCLTACGKSPQNAPAPATAMAPATAAAAGTAPAAVTSSTVASATSVAPDEATTAGPEVAGQVALAQGSVTDTAKDGSRRALKDGDSVYPGDSFVLGQDSYLDLDLEDSGRILLRPNTTFQITSYHYEPDAHEATDANGQPLIKPQQPENAFFRLVKGGLRAIDGVIGHTTPQDYGVETPVATIGVRGTTFDVRYCGDDCGDEADATGTPVNGLYTSVDDGSIGVKNDAGESVDKAGEYSYVATRHAAPKRKDHPPRALRHMRLPNKLKARADNNRNNIRVKRQKRRQLILQRRHQAAAMRAKAAAQGKPLPAAVKPGGKFQKPETPARRRQDHRDTRRQQRRDKTAAPAAVTKAKAERLQQRGEKLRQQEHEQGRAAPAQGALKRGAHGGEGGANPREQLREKRPQRQERRQEKQRESDKPAQGAAAVKKEKADKPAAGEKCKGKKKRRKGDKDKEKCGGD